MGWNTLRVARARPLCLDDNGNGLNFVRTLGGGGFEHEGNRKGKRSRSQSKPRKRRKEKRTKKGMIGMYVISVLRWLRVLSPPLE